MTDIDAKIPAELAEWLEDREEMLLAYAEDRLPGEELEPVGFEVPGSAQPTISRIEDIREIEVLEMTDRGDGILEVECRLCTDLELALNDVEHGSVTTEAIVYLSLTIDVTAGRPVEHLLVSAHHPDY